MVAYVILVSPPVRIRLLDFGLLWFWDWDWVYGTGLRTRAWQFYLTTGAHLTNLNATFFVHVVSKIVSLPSNQPQNMVLLRHHQSSSQRIDKSSASGGATFMISTFLVCTVVKTMSLPSNFPPTKFFENISFKPHLNSQGGLNQSIWIPQLSLRSSDPDRAPGVFQCFPNMRSQIFGH